MRAAGHKEVMMNVIEMETYVYDYGEDLYRFCRSLARSREEAEDLYQETFLKFYEMGEKLEIRTNPKGCLMAISVNLYRNFKRKMAIRNRIAGTALLREDLPCADADASSLTLREEEYGALVRAVNELADRYRLVILLHYREDLPLEKVAKILKIPKGTVKSRLHRAKKILKKKLEDAHYERSYE